MDDATCAAQKRRAGNERELHINVQSIDAIEHLTVQSTDATLQTRHNIHLRIVGAFFFGRQ